MSLRTDQMTMLTYDVCCHVCPHAESLHKRNRSRSIGSPRFGWLWHCEKHQVGACNCPRGEDTDPVNWWENNHEVNPATGKPWPIEEGCCSFHFPDEAWGEPLGDG